MIVKDKGARTLDRGGRIALDVDAFCKPAHPGPQHQHECNETTDAEPHGGQATWCGAPRLFGHGGLLLRTLANVAAQSTIAIASPAFSSLLKPSAKDPLH